MLYGGNPPDDLRHKFLMAQDSVVSPLTPNVLPDYMRIVPLAGHTFDMMGFRVDDTAVFLADCLSSEETLQKYRIGFLLDVPQYLATLQAVKTMTAEVFVPSHAAATDNIAPLAQHNIDTVNDIADTIVRLCRQSRSFDELLRALFDHYGLTMTFEQHALVGSTVRSYLSFLKATGRVTVSFENNLMTWQTP